MIQAVISGTGLWVPEHSVSNEELVVAFNAYVDLFNASHAAEIAAGTRQALEHSSAAFIEKASGIQRRYVVDKTGILDPHRMFPRIPARADDEPSLMAEVAVKAAMQALAQAGRKPEDVDGVICAASNMQRPYPAMAVEIQQLLGAQGFGFDMNVACSSATFGIEQAVNAVRAGTARCVLVVNPEITSGHQEWRDRDCHFIFGDVCTAVLVEAKDSCVAKEQWEVLGTQLATQFSNNIRNNFGFMNRCEDTPADARDKTFAQEGRKVFKEVVPIAAAHIERHLQKHGFKAHDVRRFWLHQANLSMNQLVVKKLLDTEPNADIAPIILDEFANTASAGSVVAFHRHRADLAPGDLGIVCSFGAGYSVGSVLIRRTQ